MSEYPLIYTDYTHVLHCTVDEPPLSLIECMAFVLGYPCHLQCARLCQWSQHPPLCPVSHGHAAEVGDTITMHSIHGHGEKAQQRYTTVQLKHYSLVSWSDISACH